MSTQLSWVLPGQRPGRSRAVLWRSATLTGRLRGVVLMMLRLHALLAGGAACVILAFNPAFVRAWVGPGLFGGLTLSALLAASILVSSIVHGLITTASVLGNRFRVGVLVLVNGVVQTVLALRWAARGAWTGIAAAGLIASPPRRCRWPRASPAVYRPRRGDCSRGSSCSRGDTCIGVRVGRGRCERPPRFGSALSRLQASRRCSPRATSGRCGRSMSGCPLAPGLAAGSCRLRLMPSASNASLG